ncbi:MAG: carbohydrate binding family 9 domain-containing protein, partial [bacterium]|nr:carbohydrate binding family 9 domain-containing protein [bacterium]
MKSLLVVIPLCILIILIPYLPVFAQSGLQPFSPIKTDTPPKIDGILDDSVWMDAPNETGFKTWYPDYEKEMKEKTVVYYAYDSENLYFAFKCYDSEPDKIKASVTSRDNIRPDDWVCLNLDTFNDQQTVYSFYINPLGIQMDAKSSVVAEDYNYDAVWYSEGKINADGYSVEVRIPFKSIRFSHNDPVEMGVIFERQIRRHSELGTYPPLDPKQGPNFFTQTRTLIYQDIKHYRLFEVLPSVTYGKSSSINQGKLKSDKDESDLSLTAKLGLTSRLILDGTVNPDFSQVEADAGQVDFNQRFALYYPEKRPFFLEGNEHFYFGGSSHGDPFGSAVHTRMIENPDIGVKMTGKVGDNSTIASIYAYDDIPDYLNEGDYANVGIFRYKYALNQDSFVGGFLSDREIDSGFNRVAGADAQIRINPQSRIGLHGFVSQNEEADETESETGHAVGINYYYNTRDYIFDLRAHDLSDDFISRTGYVTRTGVTRLRGGALRYFYPKNTEIIKRIEPMVHTVHIRDKLSDLWENGNMFDLTFVFPRSTRFRVGYAKSTEIYNSEKFKTDNFRMIASSQFTKQVSFSLSYYNSKKIRYEANPYQGKGTTASGSVIFQPNDNLYSSLSYTYRDLYRDSNDEKIFDYT